MESGPFSAASRRGSRHTFNQLTLGLGRSLSHITRTWLLQVLGVSMGQGQEIIARKYMATASQEGQWVLLQNTHLGLSYLTEVEAYLTKEADAIHEDFRLWITAEPHPAFPIGLLQMGIKITNEAPVGIKAGLRASFQWVSQDMLDAVSRFEWRQLLFIQCYIHSIVQERRKFGPIGWNIPYEFNASDLSACTQFLQNHTLEMEAKKAAEPNWSTVRYMVSQIQYGGKITDDFDMLLMDTYAEKVRWRHQFWGIIFCEDHSEQLCLGGASAQVTGCYWLLDVSVV